MKGPNQKIDRGASIVCKKSGQFSFPRILPSIIFVPGEMAERSIAAVLKTVDCKRSGGSNPSLSAK
jgi:NADH pyrophosphatase NudC (nudix superfamily)